MPFKTYSPTKAQQMRAIAVKLQESGKRPAPKDIIEEMAKKGVIISSGHASVVLRKFTGTRFRKRCRRDNKLVKQQPQNVRGTRGTRHTPSVTPTWLDAAAQFVRNCGGFSEARARLETLEGIVNLVKTR